MVLTRHADDERSVPAHDAGHLLRGASDREGSSEDGREGVRLRAQEGVPDSPQANQRADQATRPGVQETEGDAARDKMPLNAALIAAAQAVEHYEITRYGTLAAWAKLLGRNDVAKLLHTNLKEEKATDKKLSGIAKRKINRKAAARQRKRPDAIERAENSMLVAAAGIPAV